MDEPVNIVLIDSDASRLVQLTQAFGEFPLIEILEVERALYTLPPSGLDAIFLTLPAAERWNPDFKSREMQILRTSPDDQANGYPRLIITGINLTKDDPRDPLSQVRLVLELAVAKAREHNKCSEEPITRLGFWVMGLLYGITTDQLIDLIRLLFSEGSPRKIRP